MEKILLLLHTTDDGALPKAAYEAIRTARDLACSLKESTWTVGLVGKDVKPAADAIAACGAARFLGVAGDDFAAPRYATDTGAAEAIAKAAEATLVIAPSTARWARSLPGLAHRLGGPVDTHIAGVDTSDGLAVRRWYYRQRIEVVQKRAARPWVILLDSGAVEPWAGEPSEAALESLVVAAPDSLKRTTVTGIQAPETDEQTIRPDADLLFVAGAGWTKKQSDGQVRPEEAAKLIQDFVRTTKCSLGSSKSLVDLSSEGQAVLPFLTHLHQIGQTGATPRHPKGLATCCHGEEPHVVGWRFINDRRAVNTDPGCGWAQGKADVLYVADAFAVLRELTERLA